jgi:protein-arginine deiminase
VGHVDEFTSFVPDASSDKGYKFLVGDVPAAYEMLESLDPNMALPRYDQDKGYATVGEILDDNGLRTMNMDIQTDEIDPNVQKMKDEVGLTEEDIIRIPAMFETVWMCGGRVAAFFPGTVNLIVAENEDGKPPKIFMPDPFFRTNLGDQGSDPLISEVEALMPEGLEIHWLDDWDTYHMNLGEVHCGTNVLRTPTDDWWTSGLHLLEGN